MTQHKNSNASQIRAFLKQNPKAKPAVVAAALNLPRHNVYSVVQYDKRKVKAARATKKRNAANVPNLPITMHDPVNHPEHYKVGGIETIDFIKAKLTPEEFRGYLKGNVLKYASRAGHKNNAVEDAGKLAWYATRLSKEV